MTVVCDTSPLCYLILIDCVDVLPQLFNKIIIPAAVERELLAEGSYPIVQNWISHPPSWLEVQSVSILIPDLPSKLGIGEREAISLAVSLHASLIVLDDLEARKFAQKRNLIVTGLLGVLYSAGLQKQIDFSDAIQRLQQTTFRVSPALIQRFLERYAKESKS